MNSNILTWTPKLLIVNKQTQAFKMVKTSTKSDYIHPIEAELEAIARTVEIRTIHINSLVEQNNAYYVSLKAEIMKEVEQGTVIEMVSEFPSIILN